MLPKIKKCGKDGHGLTLLQGQLPMHPHSCKQTTSEYFSCGRSRGHEECLFPFCCSKYIEVWTNVTSLIYNGTAHLKNGNNGWNTKICSYFETAGGQIYKPNLRDNGVDKVGCWGHRHLTENVNSRSLKAVIKPERIGPQTVDFALPTVKFIC